MRKLFLLPVLLLAVFAAVDSSAEVISRTWRMPLTGTSCTTLDAGQGIEINGATGWHVTASATGYADGGSDSRITGGSLTCCNYGVVSSTGASGVTQGRRWHACNTSLNFTPATGVRDSTSVDFDALVGGNAKIMYLPSSLTVQLWDGGTADAGVNVDVTIEVRK